MAQSALTVTNPNPSPPTNFSFVGASPPDICPNFTKTSYANVFNMTPLNSGAGGTMVYTDGRPQSPYGVNPAPGPYFDDAAGGTNPSGPQWTSATASVLPAFATNTAALASGTGATSGGTEGTYPGTDTAPFDTPNRVGAVPASTSVAHEGAGTEVVVQKVAGAAATNYNPAVFLPYIGAGAPTATGVTGPWQMVTCSTGPALTANVMPTPNASHASSLSPAGVATISGLSAQNTASGVGTVSQTVTGTNFTPRSVIYVNGVAQTTMYTSSTSLTAATVTKKTASGTWPVTIVTDGTVTTAAFTWTFT